jgi:hypothetical protein
MDLRGLNGITYKKMTGKYLLNNVVCFFFRIYDNRFLIKKTASSDDLGLSEETPYPCAKP